MRALFVGGLLAGSVLEVGNPPPVEWDAGTATADVILQGPAARLEGRYERRDLVVPLETGERRLVVYLAGPELTGFAMGGDVQAAVARHAMLEADRAGLITLPREAAGATPARGVG